MTHEVAHDIGQRLRAVRKDKGWSQERVAYAVGLEQSDVSKIERGKRQPSLELVRRLAEALEVDVATLLSP